MLRKRLADRFVFNITIRTSKSTDISAIVAVVVGGVVVSGGGVSGDGGGDFVISVGNIYQQRVFGFKTANTNKKEKTTVSSRHRKLVQQRH